MKTTTPQTLLEVVNHFSDERTAFDHFVAHRFPNGVACPRCGCVNVKLIETRMVWRCNGCRRQFSAKVGTIFEDSPIPLSKWLPAMWLIANCKNGISSYEIARDLKVTQKSAWFMMHRVRMAMQSGTFEKLSGHVEADESYIGGRITNMHKNKRPKDKFDSSGNKTIVFGALERGGRVKTHIIDQPTRPVLKKLLLTYVVEGSHLYTDMHPGYFPMGAYFKHFSVDHQVEYAKGMVHTNGLENFWSLLKRGLKGTYVCPSPWHLSRYCDEQEFRYNWRRATDGDRFTEVLSNVTGKRLTYAKLTGKELAAGWTE